MHKLEINRKQCVATTSVTYTPCSWVAKKERFDAFQFAPANRATKSELLTIWLPFRCAILVPIRVVVAGLENELWLGSSGGKSNAGNKSGKGSEVKLHDLSEVALEKEEMSGRQQAKLHHEIFLAHEMMLQAQTRMNLRPALRISK